MAGRVGIYPGRLVAHNQGTAGTAAVQVSASSVEISSMVIKADDDNTGTLYVGNSDDVTTSNGFRLEAGQALQMDIADLSEVWLIASADGEEYCYIATKSVY